jgi:hypothetical protein
MKTISQFVKTRGRWLYKKPSEITGVYQSEVATYFAVLHLKKTLCYVIALPT